MSPPRSRLVRISTAIAVLSCLWLALGLLYVNLVLPEPQPSIFFVPSSKGMTRLLVELVAIVLGVSGLLLAAAGRLRGAPARALLPAAIAGTAVCLIAAALLI